MIERSTNETSISLSLELHGKGRAEIDTGCGFLNHMLTLFARHSSFDLSVCCKGDIDVDYHHTTEDIGICLGQAFRDKMGDKRGITRYGSIVLPMDEALVLCALDLCGRPYLSFDASFQGEKMIKFWKAEAIDEAAKATEGTVLEASNGHIDIACSKGILRVTELQMPGKKRTAVSEFLKGNSIEIGTVLG